MAKMNWNKYKHVGVVYTKAQPNRPKKPLPRIIRATAKQVELLKRLRINFHADISKRQASKLIDKRFGKKP